MTAIVSRRGRPFSSTDIVEARGCILRCTNGRRYVDFTSGFGVAALGYGNAAIRDAVSQQLRHLSHAMSSITGYKNDSLAADSIARTIGQSHAGVVITTSGSEAVEVAVKAAYLATRCPGIVVFSGAYHGQSLGSLRFNAHKALVTPFRRLLGRTAKTVPFFSHDDFALGGEPALRRWLSGLSNANAQGEAATSSVMARKNET